MNVKVVDVHFIVGRLLTVYNIMDRRAVRQVHERVENISSRLSLWVRKILEACPNATKLQFSCEYDAHLTAADIRTGHLMLPKPNLLSQSIFPVDSQGIARQWPCTKMQSIAFKWGAASRHSRPCLSMLPSRQAFASSIARSLPHAKLNGCGVEF
jgi:hypothetical protein